MRAEIVNRCKPLAWGAGGIGGVGLMIGMSFLQPADVIIGERPAVENHMSQLDINAGRVSLKDMMDHGGTVFSARFNALDGQGRPASTGTGAPRVPDEPHMIRTSAPDSTSCAGCHAQPRPGGAGDFVANVFVLAQALDPVTESVSGNFSNERNTLGMMGAGPIEMLAREMTAELHEIRDEALAIAGQTGVPQTRDLVAKGVSFGRMTAMPDGKIDPSEIDGVDWDLIIKPFHQKGAVVSLREFTNNAMNHHHGIQTVERFGADVDPDMDGVINELTVGDVTAASVFQAALDIPVQIQPKDPRRRAAVRRGSRMFDAVGCNECHVAEFTLDSREYSEPNPYNPAGNLQVFDVPEPFSFDMTRDGQKPNLERGPRGTAIIRPFTDLKRHNLNDAEFGHFDNEILAQGTLNGFADPSDFTIAPEPRPTGEFLSRKLWDAGNSDPYGHRGDLSTMTEAIYFHGGDARASRDSFFNLRSEDQAAIIEFLKSLQVVESKPGLGFGG